MDSTVSVSKGVFVFKNGAKPITKRTKSKRKASQFNNGNVFSNEPWYQAYSALWNSIETKIYDLNNEMFLSVLRNLINFIKFSYNNFVSEIPAAALLTGINMPDHAAQYLTLANEIKESVSPHVVCLHAQDCHNLKYFTENMVYQFINDNNSESDDDDLSDSKKAVIKKSQCNLSSLQAWYEDLYYDNNNTNRSSPRKKQKIKNDIKPLVIIIPDFESFSDKVLQDFILIASSYLNILPFVLVFGVATSVAALHRTLPYHVMSKINVQVFNSPSSTVYLNTVLENVFFSKNFPFHLGGKVFNLFLDIFIFYNISVTSFIQNYKYAMLEHFSYGNAMTLCSKNKNIKEIVKDLSHDDLESIRQLLSFRKLVENETYENRIKLLTDDIYFQKVLTEECFKVRCYINLFHLFLQCLHILVSDLPKCPLGKHLKDLYSVATSKDIVKCQEYKECIQLLNFQSKDALFIKICKISVLLNEEFKRVKINKSDLEEILNKINNYLDQLNTLSMSESNDTSSKDNCEETLIDVKDRQKLKEKLLERSKKTKPMNQYEQIRTDLLSYLSEQFEIHLRQPDTLNFHEIFFFNDISIQNHIIGSHRAAIHTALNDPHIYFQCSCCEIPNDSRILRSMPDISIVYKLHLECGKMINLYDWLQAFLSIVDTNEADDDGKRVVDPKLQARFTQAVAELEFLGFIKSSKRKTDHVARLTWGG